MGVNHQPDVQAVGEEVTTLIRGGRSALFAFLGYHGVPFLS